MDKPLSLRVREFESKLVEELNKSELPAFCLKQILKKIYSQLTQIENQEIKDYQEKERKEKNEKNEKTDKK